MKVERDLVIRASEGDKEAFSGIYYACYKDLYNFAFCILGNPEDAADAVSDAFVEILRGIGKLRNPDAFAAWALKILSGCCKKEISKRIKRRGLYNLDDFAEVPSFGSENMVEDISENADLSAALSELDAEERIVVVLFVLHGYTNREIAKIMGRPQGTVKSKLYRAYAKLRKSLTKP